MTTKHVNAFHQHLDACKQCREQPFNLCPAGMKLLQEAVKGAAPEPPSRR